MRRPCYPLRLAVHGLGRSNLIFVNLVVHVIVSFEVAAFAWQNMSEANEMSQPKFRRGRDKLMQVFCSWAHMWTCSTVWPAASPSCIANVIALAPTCASSALPTQRASFQASPSSACVKSFSLFTSLRGITSTWPGTTGFKFTNARQSGLSAKTSSCASFHRPNTCPDEEAIRTEARLAQTTPLDKTSIQQRRRGKKVPEEQGGGGGRHATNFFKNNSGQKATLKQDTAGNQALASAYENKEEEQIHKFTRSDRCPVHRPSFPSQVFR